MHPPHTLPASLATLTPHAHPPPPILQPPCAGTDLDTGVDPEAIMPLIDYWDAARLLYAPFESNLYWCGGRAWTASVS